MHQGYFTAANCSYERQNGAGAQRSHVSAERATSDRIEETINCRRFKLSFCNVLSSNSRRRSKRTNLLGVLKSGNDRDDFRAFCPCQGDCRGPDASGRPGNGDTAIFERAKLS
jgi:hypothetical protein